MLLSILRQYLYDPFLLKVDIFHILYMKYNRVYHSHDYVYVMWQRLRDFVDVIKVPNLLTFDLMKGRLLWISLT